LDQRITIGSACDKSKERYDVRRETGNFLDDRRMGSGVGDADQLLAQGVDSARRADCKQERAAATASAEMTLLANRIMD